MNRGQQLIQAYRQAPWRQQVQWMALFLAAVFSVGVLAYIYLSITGRAAENGRYVQNYRAQQEQLVNEIEDLESQIAELTSVKVMEQRAYDMGYRPVQRNQAVYIIVPGYAGRLAANQNKVSSAGAQENGAALPPEFTISLLEWLEQELTQWALKYGALGGQP